jgi:hypothetical protein
MKMFAIQKKTYGFDRENYFPFLNEKHSSLIINRVALFAA